ncbi:hypothetical protein [Sphingomonas flavescens]|nr:hypothetical protein [Sphingomonas limnosediminicola]
MNADQYITPGRVRDAARLGAVRISQLDNHCCDLIDRIAPIANHGIDF